MQADQTDSIAVILVQTGRDIYLRNVIKLHQTAFNAVVSCLFFLGTYIFRGGIENNSVLTLAQTRK